MTTLQDAVDDLYRIAVIEKKPTSTKRLQKLANYCCEQLAQRGIPGLKCEIPVEGTGRKKNWDVALVTDDYFRLGVSLKSMLSNLPGSVPNRVDDLQGELHSAQSRFAKVVIGYMILIDASKDYHSDKHGMTWTAKMRDDVTRMSARTTGNPAVGQMEASVVVEVNFAAGPKLLTPEATIQRFFDRLALEYKLRWP